MSDDGYTLLEMLVALMVVGMTAAGLASGAFALARIQGQTSRTLTSARSLATLQDRFSAFLEGRGPFKSDEKPAGFEGSGDQLQFRCGGGTCTAELIQGPAGAVLDLGREDGTHSRVALPGVAGASFAYEGGGAERSAWPPSEGSVRLKSVTILGGFEPDRKPLAIASLSVGQTPDCQFDPIIKDCRAPDESR